MGNNSSNYYNSLKIKKLNIVVAFTCLMYVYLSPCGIQRHSSYFFTKIFKSRFLPVMRGESWKEWRTARKLST